MSKQQNRILQLVLGKKGVQTVKRWNVLLAGAGGIGCEVIKNMSKSGFSRVTILDFDTIEETNLNRQFYFRQKHIGDSKANILKCQIEKIVPQLQVTAICNNLYSNELNERFYQKFDLIISALDSIKAREHLAAQATRNSKPLIDAGTMSYHGQAYASIRFKTTCHNCEPGRIDQEAGPCLIRAKPERPIHCGTYAKNFYDSFFGSKGKAMSESLSPQKFFARIETADETTLQQVAQQIFSLLFDEGIADVDMQDQKIDSVRKLKLKEALSSLEKVKNPPSTFNIKEQQKQNSSLYREQQLWSLRQYAESFIGSMTNLLKRKYKGTVPCAFQKDDEDVMLLVCCITNLRTYNFMNWESFSNQHKFLTYYQCKDLVGKVMPAIASANAIAGALQIREAINLALQRYDKMRVIHFTNQGDERLSPCFQSAPLINCNFCSQKIIYAKAELDINRITFGQFEQFAKAELLSFGRDLYSGSFALVKNSKKTPSPNKNQTISLAKDLMHQGVLSVSFGQVLKGTPIIVHISIFHKEGVNGIHLFQTLSKKQLKLQLIRYFRKVHESNTFLMASDLKIYGGYQF